MRFDLTVDIASISTEWLLSRRLRYCAEGIVMVLYNGIVVLGAFLANDQHGMRVVNNDANGQSVLNNER